MPKKLRGQTDHRAAELVDLFPTVLEAADIKIPASGVGLDLLGGEKRQGSFCALHQRKDEAAFMWRTAGHKLILRMKRNADDDASKYSTDDIIGGEFYDLNKDSQEWNDLYSNPKADRKAIATMTKELMLLLGKQRKLT